MYCPKCLAEFGEGVIFCEACHQELSELLPQESFKPDKQTTSNHNVWFHLNVAIEKILKVGGMIYILIGIIYNVYMALNNHQSHVSALKIISYLCYTLISTILLGLFYYGMGRIIELLREGLSNEKR